MARPRKDAETPARKRPPATTAEARQKELIGLAIDLVERKLRDGSATSQETVHFLKLATAKNELEEKKLIAEGKLLDARVETMAQNGNIEKLYSEAIAAFASYQTGEDSEEYLD